MWSYLETLSGSSKSDIWDRQIHNWRWKLFKCNTVISMRDINISIWALKNGVKIPKKIKLQEILSITLAQKFHNNSWLHMKLFIIECKNWTLLSNLYASIFDKIQQDIIQEVSDIYIVLINMLNFKNSIWPLIGNRTLVAVWCVSCRAHQTRRSGRLLRLGFNEVTQFLSKSEVLVALSVFSSPYFFPPIIILFLQYSHKRSSHVPEMWPIQSLMINILFQTR